MQAGVVEEVVEDLLTPPAARRLLDVARRDRVPREDVADDCRDPHLGARLDERSHVGLERCVAALVLGHLRLADPHDGAVRGCVEAEHDPPSAPPLRDPRRRLVPDITNVVPRLCSGEHVVEAGWDGDLLCTAELPRPPPFVPTPTVGVELEAPEPVQGLSFSGRSLPGPQHVYRLT